MQIFELKPIRCLFCCLLSETSYKAEFNFNPPRWGSFTQTDDAKALLQLLNISLIYFIFYNLEIPQAETGRFVSRRLLMSRFTVCRTALFVCDIQERFKSLINGFASVVASANYMLNACQELGIPVVHTEQVSPPQCPWEAALKHDSTESGGDGNDAF